MDVCGALTGWSAIVCYVVVGIVSGLSAAGVLHVTDRVKRATGRLPVEKEKEK
jgi:hypothetical protein